MHRYHPRHAERGSAGVKLIAYLAAVAVAAVSVFTGLADATANGNDPAPVADYNTGGRWPTSMTELCIEDKTHGFPVAEAAKDFDGLVDMKVQADCTGEPFIVHVITADEPGQKWMGKFSAYYVNDDEQARVYRDGWIQLNIGRAYRIDADDWRVVLIHELGHAVGLGHADAGYSVMDPSRAMYQNRHLTETDREQIRAIYGKG